MRLITVVGARPQFVKAAAVSRALQETTGVEETLVHTGQHFDANMSGVFFDQLGVPAPRFHLGVHSATHGDMTGRMLQALERTMLDERPDRVLVYGDTNSTLAGALAAVKLHIPVAHVEAGLRSFDRSMPEEINRVVVDHLSDRLYCPTQAAVANLSQEGIAAGSATVELVGDVMQDATNLFAQAAEPPPGLAGLDGFMVATVHRAENTDDEARLSAIVAALNEIHHELAPLVVPLHPRTEAALSRYGLRLEARTIEPQGYLQMLWLLAHAALVLTDSGGLQKEAYFFGKPCITLRDRTEWVELVEVGANTLVPADRDAIVAAAHFRFGMSIEVDPSLYGGGTAAARIAASLAS